MFRCLKDQKPCLPLWWIELTQKHSRLIVVLALLLTAAILFYTLLNFKINTDLTEMVSTKLHFRKVERTFQTTFPVLQKSIVVVVDADTPEQSLQGRDRLAKRLKQRSDLFNSVYAPGSGTFYDKNALLYLSGDELEALTDSLSEVQPFLALLSKDFTLTGLISVIEKVLHDYDHLIGDNDRMRLMFDRLSEAFASAGQDRPYRVTWQDIMVDPEVTGPPGYQFIIVQPVLDFSVLNPAEKAIEAIRSLANELQITDENGIRIRITGNLAISHEDLLSVRTGIGIASLVSLILVGVILYVGLGSGRLVFVSILTLVVGLSWTLGFAIAMIGRLNLISITFVVLFIGLGVDYSIQICLRYRELCGMGWRHEEAIRVTLQRISNALLLCSVTTAIGFYAFVPTSYAGASELGMISGTGMLINFVANVTLLPALLNLMPHKMAQQRSFTAGRCLSAVLDRFALPIVAGAIIATVGSATLLPKVFFDANPLNLSDQDAESILTAKELFDGEETSPWTISVLSSTLGEARGLAARLGNLQEVETAITVADFIPGNQREKLDLISDIALFMPPAPQEPRDNSQSNQQSKASLKSLELTLRDLLQSNVDGNKRFMETLRHLYEHVERVNLLLENPERGVHILKALEESLLPNLSILLERFEKLMQPSSFGISDLPPELTHRFVSSRGLYRIQVFPKENLTDMAALERFITAVRALAPDATDSAVNILESGRVISSAFRDAAIFALLLIAGFLALVAKKWFEVPLILSPLLLAILFTSATTVLLDIPFNFENIIVVPLLLGVGVDFSIHLIHRFRSASAAEHNILQTSTARAVFFSAITTVASFSSLSFLRHVGTASMGKLLTLCIGFIIVCTLLVLPAFLRLYNPYKRDGSEDRS